MTASSAREVTEGRQWEVWQRRGGASAQNAMKSHCLNGHPFSGSNLYTRNGKRYCRACQNQRKRQQRKQRAITKE